MVLQNFIVFEGIDGAGTTTQLDLLRNNHKADDFLFTAEPTPTPTGKFLRQMLKGDIPVQPQTAAYLFAADRYEHVFGNVSTSERTLSTGIETACKKGTVVISDRYFFSSLAYQSIDCGMDLPLKLNSVFPLPSLLFFFEIEPEVSLKRITSRGFTEIYEKLDFLKKTESAYRTVIERYDGTPLGETMRIVRIDATKPKQEIESIIWAEISK